MGGALPREEEGAHRKKEKHMKPEEIELKGRLDGTQRNRLARLLDMLYSPSELAEEVGFDQRQVYRVYIPLGCPYEKDSTGRIWINGLLFKNWVNDHYKKQNLKQNEAFCLTCKKAVKMVDPQRIQEGRLFYYLCTCPICGRKLARIIVRGKPINDQSE
ncbi:MAG: hypothetical protein CVU42_17640 [Chloroflexi bacterium HGW-Chloroflexi-4]|jgi:hypothetical protein|nr:MAG: hypothetical protein CVU42_17640 [Chloroflexi bacterium HGW-Chloroflexi-4]